MNDYEQKKAGLRGENITKKEIMKLGPSFLRINGRRISLGSVSQSAEIDHLIIGKSGIFVIDSKHWSGKIEFTYPGIKQTKPNLMERS